MVKKERSVYLFLGQNTPSKNVVLNKLKKEILPQETEQFNLDILYGRELTLKGLQEKLLFLPTKDKKRMVVIKCAQDLKDEVKKFVLDYCKDPPDNLVLILDIEKTKENESFVRGFLGHAQVLHFSEEKKADVFVLSKYIDAKKADLSLKVLNQLLKDGEKPERILGGLRASWQRHIVDPSIIRRRMKLLLQSDIDLKTGKLKPAFILERLVVNLCGLSKLPS